MKNFPTLKQGFIFLLIIGFCIFFNILLNDFVWDDKEQIIKPPIIHNVKYLPLTLITSVHFHNASTVLDYYYKPIMYSFFSLFYFLGNGEPLHFHLFQILAHIVNAFFIFYLFRKFLSNKTALFLGAVFLVHPANEETVAYISSLQDVLFLFFGMIAVILAFNKKKLSFKNQFLINSTLLLSLLSKETGILFVLLVIALLYFGKIKKLGSAMLFICTTLGAYIVLRVISYNFSFLFLNSSDLQTLNFLQRLNHIPNIFLFYLREIIFPINKITPRLFEVSNSINFYTILFFLVLVVFIIGVLFLIGNKFKKSNKIYFRYLMFFIFWVFLGIIFHLQLISFDIVVSTRWLYFPLVGFLGVLGLIFESIKNKPLRQLISVLGILIILSFFLQTIQLNSYWKNEEILNKNVENLSF